jgi:hypothetical protein
VVEYTNKIFQNGEVTMLAYKIPKLMHKTIILAINVLGVMAVSGCGQNKAPAAETTSKSAFATFRGIFGIIVAEIAVLVRSR